MSNTTDTTTKPKRKRRLMPQNLPQPDSEVTRKRIANEHITIARNIEAFGTANPPDLPELKCVKLEKGNAGDLLLLPQRSRARTLLFLDKFAFYKRYNEAMKASAVEYWEVEQARRLSKTYSTMFDMVKDTIIQGRVTDIETAIAADAAGEEPEKGRRRPDTKAAGLFLAANDARYRPQANSTNAVVMLDMHF